MALAIDASSPAVVTQATNTVATVASASFTPPANSVLLILWSGDALGTPAAPSITDNLGSPLTYTRTDWQSIADTPGAHGQAAAWTAPVGSSPTAMTVTVTSGSVSGERCAALKVVVWTGADTASPVGAHGKSGSVSASSIAQTYSAQATGGQGAIADTDFDQVGAQTAGTGCTLFGSANVSTAMTYGFTRRTSADDTSGSNNTLNVTLPATSTNVTWVYVEMKPAAAAASTFIPQAGSYRRRPAPARVVARQRQRTIPAPVAATVPRQTRVRAPALRVPVWAAVHRRGTTVPVKPVAAPPPAMPRLRAPAVRVPIWLRRRGALPQPVTPVAAAMPLATRMRVAIARLPVLNRRRGTTVPASAAAVAVPPFVPAPGRSRAVRTPVWPRRRAAGWPPDTQTQPWLIPAIRRVIRLPASTRHSRPTVLAPAPVPAPWPPMIVRRVIRTWPRRRPGVLAPPMPQQATGAPPPWPPTIFRRLIRPPVTRRARITQPVPPPVAAPWPVPAIRRIVRLLFVRRAKLPPLPPPPFVAWPPPAVRHPVRLPWHRRLARRLAWVFGGVALGPPPAADFASDSTATAMLTTDQAATALVSATSGEVSFVDADAAGADLPSVDTAAQWRSGTG